MAISDILLLGDPALYLKSEEVKQEELPQLLPQIQLMHESILDIRKHFGFGRAIAAPQIGLSKRIIALNIDQPEVIINPVLSNLSTEMMELWDDCMSFPNLLVKVQRHKKLTLTYFNINWQKQIRHLKNDMAELIQHEYDHLEGILATQRAINNRSFKWKK